MVKLLLYVHDLEIAQIYLKLAAEVNIECEVVHSFEEFYKKHQAQPYSGLLVDIVSSIRASTFDRATLKDLMAVYPSLRLRWDPAGGDMRTLMTGAGAGQKVSLEQFVVTYCRLFTPRALRLHCRKELHCSVLCSVYGDMPEDSIERTVTADVSVGGCFLYSSHCLTKGTTLWLRFIDLVDNTPIQVEVVWCREWGKTTRLPGVGVKFLKIRDEQRQEFGAMVDCDHCES